MPLTRHPALGNEATTDGRHHAQQGGSFFDNPYRCCTELSIAWQIAFIAAQTPLAVNIMQGRDMPPSEWNTPRTIPDDLMSWQPIYQRPTI